MPNYVLQTKEGKLSKVVKSEKEAFNIAKDMVEKGTTEEIRIFKGIGAIRKKDSGSLEVSRIVESYETKTI